MLIVITLAIVHGSRQQRGGKRPAKKQYDSTYFNLKAEYARKLCDDWILISEKYGVLDPTESIEVYDIALDDLTEAETEEWAETLHEKITQRVVDTDGGHHYDRVDLLMGQDLVSLLDSLRKDLEAAGIEVQTPLRGEGGIPKQQRWLRKAIDRRT